MSIPNEYKEIIASLALKSEQGNVHWKKGKFDISVAIDDSTFSLWAGNDENTEVPFVAFALKDKNEATLDTWYVEESDGNSYLQMLRLYNSAKRHALGVPSRLKQLTAKLAESQTIGKAEK